MLNFHFGIRLILVYGELIFLKFVCDLIWLGVG
jgi:hypothetical protein